MTVASPPFPVPWPRFSRATARPLRFQGHPDAELDPWFDQGHVLVFAESFGQVVDYPIQSMWLPEESWLAAESRADTLGWAIKPPRRDGETYQPGDLVYYRCSADTASRRGRTVTFGRGGDRRWVVPMWLLDIVTLDRKGQPVVSKVKR